MTEGILLKDVIGFSSELPSDVLPAPAPNSGTIFYQQKGVEKKSKQSHNY